MASGAAESTGPAPSGRVVHEAIWAPLAVTALLAARFAPPSALAVFGCPFKALTGWACLTCGGTRAFRALVRFDLATAFEMNPLVALLGLGAGVYIAHALLVAAGRRRPYRLNPRSRLWGVLRGVLVAAAVLNWSYLLWVGR